MLGAYGEPMRRADGSSAPVRLGSPQSVALDPQPQPHHCPTAAPPRAASRRFTALRFARIAATQHGAELRRDLALEPRLVVLARMLARAAELHSSTVSARDLVGAVLSDDQNGDHRFSHNRFRNTTKPQSLESRAAVASHYDEIGARVLRDIEQSRRWVAL